MRERGGERGAAGKEAKTEIRTPNSQRDAADAAGDLANGAGAGGLGAAGEDLLGVFRVEAGAQVLGQCGARGEEGEEREDDSEAGHVVVLGVCLQSRNERR